MIKKIAHLADYHIHNYKWFDRYREGNEFIYDELTKLNPDRIVIVGDLFENFTNISNEAKILAGEFLTKLSNISKVIIVIGNHDIMKRNKNRKNSIETIVKLLNNPNITYYDKSGFYEDENVMWVNHSHLEKNINPWNDIQHIKEENKIYIDLWHDPINGCISDNGFEMKSNSYRNISDFKGDFSFFGDIHKHQIWYNDDNTPKAAMPSSTYQQTMGEDVEKHGFLMWNILNKTVDFVTVPDKYKLLCFNITSGFDYDSINFEHPLANENCDFKIKWEDYSHNINLENTNKIKNYFKQKYNVEKLKFEKNRIYNNINNSIEKITTSLNINDETIQRQIFKEFLKLNKLEDSMIDEILSIDDIINSKLDKKNILNNIEWVIEKFWIENFKSYEKETIEWKDMNGIIQIGGLNQHGKTTLLDAICYILYGTTLSTNKLGGAQREKFADNSFINNKRNLDYCKGGAIIDINGEKFTLVRETKREWKKGNKEIKSVSTTLDIYIGDEIKEENKQTDEVKIQTQNKLDSIFGDFSDFIRLSFTNSENLNDLISMDRATFIDSVIKDAGYDIFEKKLQILKEYKKDITKNDIKINLEESENKLKLIEEEINLKIQEQLNLTNDINKIKTNIDELTSNKNDNIKKLHKVDNDIININVEDTNEKLKEYSNNILTYKSKKQQNLLSIEKLNSKFDEVSYNEKLKELKKVEDDNLNKKLEISKIEKEIDKNINNKNNINSKIKELKTNKLNEFISTIKDKNNEIDKYQDKIINGLEKIKNNINLEIQKFESDNTVIENDIKNLKERAIEKKNEITELEDSKNSNICLTCNRPYDESHIEHLNEKIKNLNDDISKLFNDAKDKKSKINLNKEEIDKLKLKITNIDNKIYTDDIKSVINKINDKISELNNDISLLNISKDNLLKDEYNDISDLKLEVDNQLILRENCTNNISKLENDILNIKKSIIDYDNKITFIKNEILKLDNIKKEVQLYNNALQENKEIDLKIENIKLTVENAKEKINRYYDQVVFINENNKINEEISKIDDEILLKEEEYNDLITSKNTVDSDIKYQQLQFNDVKNNINIYLEQIKRDEIINEYYKCIHRDGIPTYLLHKSREMLNVEMTDYLSNVDFDIYFDENLVLKMYMKKNKNSDQKLLQSSGKERTFGAICLKFVLRAINNRSKPNILFLDEVMTKLVGDSVDEFNELLKVVKNKINKIIIIEHVHQVEYDMLLEVTKDENNISHLKYN